MFNAEDYIHATIRSNFVGLYHDFLKESDIFMIHNFTVKPNKDNFRVVSDSNTMLQLHANTTVEEIETDSSQTLRYKFDFFDFDKLHL